MPLYMTWIWLIGLTPTSKWWIYSDDITQFCEVDIYADELQFIYWYSHFIVPEMGPDVEFSYASHKAVEEYKEAKAVCLMDCSPIPLIVHMVVLISKHLGNLN